eukprot:95406_1
MAASFSDYQTDFLQRRTPAEGSGSYWLPNITGRISRGQYSGQCSHCDRAIFADKKHKCRTRNGWKCLKKSFSVRPRYWHKHQECVKSHKFCFRPPKCWKKGQTCGPSCNHPARQELPSRRSRRDTDDSSSQTSLRKVRRVGPSCSNDVSSSSVANSESEGNPRKHFTRSRAPPPTAKALPPPASPEPSPERDSSPPAKSASRPPPIPRRVRPNRKRIVYSPAEPEPVPTQPNPVGSVAKRILPAPCESQRAPEKPKASSKSNHKSKANHAHTSNANKTDVVKRKSKQKVVTLKPTSSKPNNNSKSKVSSKSQARRLKPVRSRSKSAKPKPHQSEADLSKDYKNIINAIIPDIPLHNHKNATKHAKRSRSPSVDIDLLPKPKSKRTKTPLSKQSTQDLKNNVGSLSNVESLPRRSKRIVTPKSCSSARLSFDSLVTESSSPLCHTLPEHMREHFLSNQSTQKAQSKPPINLTGSKPGQATSNNRSDINSHSETNSQAIQGKPTNSSQLTSSFDRPPPISRTLRHLNNLTASDQVSSSSGAVESYSNDVIEIQDSAPSDMSVPMQPFDGDSPLMCGNSGGRVSPYRAPSPEKYIDLLESMDEDVSGAGEGNRYRSVLTESELNEFIELDYDHDMMSELIDNQRNGKINEQVENERNVNERIENEHNVNERFENEAIENEHNVNEPIENEHNMNESIENELVESEHIGNELVESEHIENEREPNERVENERIENEHVENEHSGNEHSVDEQTPTRRVSIQRSQSNVVPNQLMSGFNHQFTNQCHVNQRSSNSLVPTTQRMDVANYQGQFLSERRMSGSFEEIPEPGQILSQQQQQLIGSLNPPNQAPSVFSSNGPSTSQPKKPFRWQSSTEYAFLKAIHENMAYHSSPDSIHWESLLRRLPPSIRHVSIHTLRFKAQQFRRSGTFENYPKYAGNGQKRQVSAGTINSPYIFFWDSAKREDFLCALRRHLRTAKSGRIDWKSLVANLPLSLRTTTLTILQAKEAELRSEGLLDVDYSCVVRIKRCKFDSCRKLFIADSKACEDHLYAHRICVRTTMKSINAPKTSYANGQLRHPERYSCEQPGCDSEFWRCFDMMLHIWAHGKTPRPKPFACQFCGNQKMLCRMLHFREQNGVS